MEKIYAKNRKEWRKWLEKNHKTATEIHLVYYKITSGKESITWEESVEEALCFGWIDGIRRKVDDEQYTVRFTERKPKSIWSLINKNKVEKLISEGKMMPLGLEKIEHAKQNGQWHKAYSMKGETELPEDFEKALNKNKKALENFNKLSPSNRFTYVYQINAVKKAESRAARIKKVVDLLENNIKPYENGIKQITN